MEMSDMRLFCKTVAAVTAFCLIILSSQIQAVADEVPRSWAIVTLTGSATINNAPAVSGQTLFAANTIATARSSSLILDVPRATRLEISEQTELNVEVRSDLLLAVLKTGHLSFLTVRGAATRVQILPGLSVVSDPTTPANFTVSAMDTNFELKVAEGAVDVLDSRETNKGEQVTHVGPNKTFSNAGLVQTNVDRSSLTTRQRALIFIAAGGSLALLFMAIVIGSDPVTDGPGGCVILSSGRTPQTGC